MSHDDKTFEEIVGNLAGDTYDVYVAFCPECQKPHSDNTVEGVKDRVIAHLQQEHGFVPTTPLERFAHHLGAILGGLLLFALTILAALAVVYLFRKLFP